MAINSERQGQNYIGDVFHNNNWICSITNFVNGEDIQLFSSLQIFEKLSILKFLVEIALPLTTADIKTVLHY